MRSLGRLKEGKHKGKEIKIMDIYLAGGFYTGWQERVRESAGHHCFYNPEKDTDQNYPFVFVYDDVKNIRQSDLVVAYYARTNPSGIGLACEMGMAVAQNIPIIYIDENERINSFLASLAKRTYSSLGPAIEYLKGLNRQEDQVKKQGGGSDIKGSRADYTERD